MVHKVELNRIKNKGNITLDREAQKYGIVVNNYHTDDGIFNDEDFMKDIFKYYQKIELSGTGYPHHNLSIEEEIKIVVNMARSMMIHADLRHPKIKTKQENIQWQ